MSPEKREELRAAVLVKVYQDTDYSVGRFAVSSTIFIVSFCTLTFGTAFSGVALLGKEEWEKVASVVLFIFCLSIIVSILRAFLGFAMRKIIPQEIRLGRSVLTITQKDGSVIRIPYNHCRWSQRTCFAFYGYYGTGLSRSGLLFYLPSEKMEKLFLLLVPLSSGEKALWIEKLHVSCEEIKPAYWRMFAVLMIPISVCVPVFCGIGLIQLGLLPFTVYSYVCFISAISGSILGLFSIKFASPPEARHLAIKPYNKWLERWGGVIWTTILGLGFPLLITINVMNKMNMNNVPGIVWCFIFWGIMLVLTGSLSDVMYRYRRRKDTTSTAW